MHRRASRTYASTNAPVGQASRPRGTFHSDRWHAGIVDQLQVGQQRRQKKPASLLPVEQQRVLADPAQAGQLGKLAFQKRAPC